MHRRQGWNLAGGRHQVIGKTAGLENTVSVVDEFLIESRREPLHERAVNLALRQQGIEQFSGVVHGIIAVDAHGAD